MKPKKGNNWTAYYDPDTKRYFAEIIYTSREGREQYNYEITQDIYSRLGTFDDDTDNERLSVAMDPETLIREIEAQNGIEITPESLMISERASLLLPWHHRVDVLEEERQKKAKFSGPN